MAESTDDEILARRAEELARITANTDKDGSLIPVVRFMLAGHLCAVASDRVAEITPLRNVTFVPGLPAYYLGVLHLRGLVYAVLDPSSLLGLSERGLKNVSNVILIEDRECALGLAADKILDTDFVHLDDPLVTNDLYQPVRGRGAEAYIDIGRLLADPRIFVNHDALG